LGSQTRRYIFLQGIEDKKVYYFSSPKLNTPVPHYYICIKRTDNDVLILTCCTSQDDTIIKFINYNHLPYTTLVWVTAKDPSNPFTVETFVNCNQYHLYSVDEFKQMYNSNTIDFSGEISDVHYEQIVVGLHSSPLIEPEIKELIPKSIQ